MSDTRGAGTDGLDRREFLARGGRLALGGAAVVVLPGWVTAGSRSTVDPRVVELAGLVQGTVVTPADTAYDSARRLYSPRYDSVRPGAIVFCETTQDVWRTVRWAKRHSIRVVARAGGHSYAGYSTCRGVVADVTRLSNVTVNPVAGTATVGAGARLIDVDQQLFQSGVMIPAGSCPTVGIAGLTLGGGHGFSGRKYGLTCDNLRSLTIVTASGQALLASQTQHPDLFWACRGGGAGQFGIVTSFVFNTHPASDVVTYRATWNWSDAAEDRRSLAGMGADRARRALLDVRPDRDRRAWRSDRRVERPVLRRHRRSADAASAARQCCAAEDDGDPSPFVRQRSARLGQLLGGRPLPHRGPERGGRPFRLPGQVRTTSRRRCRAAGSRP